MSKYIPVWKQLDFESKGAYNEYKKEWNRTKNIEGELAYLLTHHSIDDMPGFRE